MNNNYPNFYAEPQEQSIEKRVSAIMKKVYVKMFLGLIVTALVALWCTYTPSVIEFFTLNHWAMWVLIAAEFGMVFALSGAINRLSTGTASLLFFLFAVINGLMLFPIFFVFSPGSIYKTFFITAAVFGAMSIYGYTTSQDLTKWGSILLMALIGLIICSLVNIFMKSDTMSWLISGVGVLIFVGLTAWDTQQVKRMAIMAPNETTGKLATLGALSLYLDFINLFLYLLRFFGSRD